MRATAEPRIVDLLEDWAIHLRARNVAETTIRSYAAVARDFLTWLDTQGMPATAGGVAREHVEAYLAAMFARTTRRGQPMSAANVAKHYRSLRQLFRWLTDDGEIAVSPMARMTAPAVPEQPPPVLTDVDLTALLAACKGPSYINRRDEAIVRVLLDTGVRVSELAGIDLADVDRDQQVLHVLGKGRRPRAVPYGFKTGDAISRYLRARRAHPLAGAVDALWLGRKGRLSPSGIAQMLDRRAADAGVPGVHPHRFRHTFAHSWLAAGGQERDLMRLAGWRSPEMLSRYGASAADQRAREAHRRARLGDRF